MIGLMAAASSFNSPTKLTRPQGRLNSHIRWQENQRVNFPELGGMTAVVTPQPSGRPDDGQKECHRNSGRRGEGRRWNSGIPTASQVNWMLIASRRRQCSSFRTGCVGVVLTGGDSDGTGGARAIKAHGRVVIFQQPYEAATPFKVASTAILGGKITRG